ncbi:MAG: D-glycero-beta-D-manno-heptose 1-phosphate adenylyltransferase [Candidatus Omnitrophica bacterium CG11_big_fil_rev_8_21_14_0_20_45_26]|uniref:D-glycero-beta-D-manno-heptose 1-phosphate adenylyltransferase n=1 Tax=Candidatus Abzuiibacterium crystallinum TaxID=1974748 RepID=A0A2H0LS58_9BACT|nr:MAG: D-glycero-beta-D-manno-heptose 1-phosphate adenylyltransferase [Candidatus Omnitrophica bacterium CG11_big_fil_rev_8_21_14_0_20_45_26]PIW64977.1 MAG: D-glycero-beta-D-manno-heptose 1-phosphate adenylyltransferase [Candidatus Omnitrophica bacterium CG12_big_fil_rev_8_21_14_0_65_45_16]
MNKKIKSKNAAQRAVKRLRRQKKKVVFTNGCFDVLHVGHVRYLSKAKEFGDVLIVGLNSDRSIRQLKGPGRPINRLSARAEVLAGLSSVDLIVAFNDKTPQALIRFLKPDVLVKGADYRIKEIAGAREVTASGGRVRRVPLVKGFSTSTLIRRAKLWRK